MNDQILELEEDLSRTIDLLIETKIQNEQLICRLRAFEALTKEMLKARAFEKWESFHLSIDKLRALLPLLPDKRKPDEGIE